MFMLVCVCLLFSAICSLPTLCYISAGTSYAHVSVRHKSVFYRDSWMNWAVFFGPGAFFTHPKGNSGFLQNRSTLFWNFFLNSRRRKFCHSISIVKTCYQLCSRKFHMKVYHSVRQALCTAWFHRTGQLATADTCFKNTVGHAVKLLPISNYIWWDYHSTVFVFVIRVSGTYINEQVLWLCFCLQCFNAVGWVAGRASGL